MAEPFFIVSGAGELIHAVFQMFVGRKDMLREDLAVFCLIGIFLFRS